MRLTFYLLLILLFSFGCKSTRIEVDTIYTAKEIVSISDQTTFNSMAVKDGKIISTGLNGKKWNKKWKAKQNIKFDGVIYPGFIDAHCHFYGYSKLLNRCDLTGSKSFEEVIERIKHFAKLHPNGWILGRGWDQNDWPIKQFPDNKILSELFPDRPIALTRVDGHAMLVNKKAFNIGIAEDNAPIRMVEGGEIIINNITPTGILIDNAMDAINQVIPKPTDKDICDALLIGQDSCLKYGLTMLADAGLEYHIIQLIDSLHRTGDLKIRIYAMLDCYDKDNIKYMQNGPYETERLKVNSVKIYGDGSLGSRGAMLKKPYCDRPGHSGKLINNTIWFDSVINMYSKNGFQINTHCIGDSAIRLLLETYSKYLTPGNDKRWRIEHAQIMDTADLFFFKKYNIIPSVQPTHAISDLPWATDRLCKNRLVGAYTYKKLLEQNGWLPLGTDFPVEGLSPFKTIQAAIGSDIPEDKKQSLEFYKSHTITLDQSLKGITTWAARSCFWENEIGSLEIGKWADFVVLDEKLSIQQLSPKVKTVYIKGLKVSGN